MRVFGFSLGAAAAWMMFTTAVFDSSACSRAAVATEDANGPMAVDVEIVRAQTLRSTVVGAGVVAPAPLGDWTIFATDNGRIAEMPKAEGDAVVRGDLLVRFDFSSLSDDILAKQSDVATAMARLETAKAQVVKISGLFDRGYTARNDLEAAKGAVTTAELDLALAQQHLKASTAAADRAVVKARFAGVIAKRFHSEGDMVNGLTSDPVLRVVDPSRTQVAMSVSIEDLAKIQQGQTATLVSMNGPEPGTVLARPAPTDPHATTQEIRLGFASPSTLAIDSPIQIEILLAERPNVVAVPKAAVLRADDGTSFVMVVGVDSRAHRRDVHVGLSTRDRVEIVAGVTPGDRVIAKDAAQIAEGVWLAIDR